MFLFTERCPAIGSGRADHGDDEQVIEWIEQLGDDRFDVREAAKQQLKSLGSDAFDLLYASRDHQDLEVRLSVRTLISAIEVPWVDPTESETIQGLMSGFGLQHTLERRDRIAQIARFESLSALRALVRIARYETDELLAKAAALHVMSRKLPRDEDERAAMLDVILTTIAASPRDSCHWLRTYTRCVMADAPSTFDWQPIIEKELSRPSLADARYQEHLTVARQLVLWHADFLIAYEQIELAEASVERSLSLWTNSRESVLEILEWLTQRRIWRAVDRLVVEVPEVFETDPFLLYHVAEVQLKAGNEAAAEQIAQRASRVMGDDGRSHVETGVQLRQNGLSRWAETEFRVAIECSVMGSIPNTDARLLLAQLWSEQSNYRAAAELLQELISAIDEDANLERTVSARRPIPLLISLAEYNFALEQISRDDSESAWQHLVASNVADPTDPDTIILMAQLGTQRSDWQAEAEQRIANAIGYYRDQILSLESELLDVEMGGLQQVYERYLAKYSNQLAWLLVQTGGDRNDALRNSRRAVELMPATAGYRDTLSHCFEQRGDQEAAIAEQREAVRLAPHSPVFASRLEQLLDK